MNKKSTQAGHTADKHDCTDAIKYAQAGGGCGVCERRGFPLFLVRTAVIPKDLLTAIKGVSALTAREPEQPLETHQYVYRTLRTGYVYIRLQRSDNLVDIDAYQVTKKGELRKLDSKLAMSAPIEELTPACTTKNHTIPAMFVNINTQIYKKAWVAYSARAWNQKAIEHYKQDDADLLRFTEVDLSATTADKVASSQRSFSFDQLIDGSKTLLELELEQDKVQSYYKAHETEGEPDPLKRLVETKQASESFIQGSFYSAAHFFSWIDSKNDTTGNQASFVSKLKGQLDSIIDASPLVNASGSKALAVVVLEDTLGIAEELSVQRRLSIAPYIDQMKALNSNLVQEMALAYERIRGKKNTTYYKELKDHYKSDLKDQSDSDKIAFTAESVNDLPINQDARDKFVKATRNGDSSAMGETISYWFSRKSRADQINDYLRNLRCDSPQDYFNKEMALMREIMSCIEQYKGMLYRQAELSHVNTQPEERIAIYDKQGRCIDMIGVNGAYVFKRQAGGRYPHYNADHPSASSAPLNPASYGAAVELPLSKEQANKYTMDYLISSGQYNRSAQIGSLKRFIYYDSISRKIRKDFDKEWARYEAHLNTKGYTIFKSKNEQSYNRLKTELETFSTDYCAYVTWLFGSEKQVAALNALATEERSAKQSSPSTLQTAKTNFNKTHFWLRECEADCSDAYLGYLQDVNIILDSGYLGEMLVEKQFAISQLLMADDQSIYFHLLNGGTLEKSLWTDMQQQSEMSDKSDLNAKRAAILDNLKSISGLSLSDQHLSLAAVLYQKMVGNITAGMTRAPLPASVAKSLPNENFTKHLLESSRFFDNNSGVHLFHLKSKVKDLPAIFDKLYSSSPYFKSAVDMDTIRLSTSGGTLTVSRGSNGLWQVEGIANMNKSVRYKVVVAVDSQAELESAVKNLTGNKRGLGPVSGSADISHRIVDLTDYDLSAEAVNQHWDSAKLQKQGAIVDASVAGALNLVMLGLQYQALSYNLAELESEVTDQTIRDKLAKEVSQAYLSMCTNLIEVIHYGMTIGHYSGMFNISKELFAGLKSVAKILGTVGSAIAVVDGFMTLQKALTALQNENSGAIGFMVGSVFALVGAGLMTIAPLLSIPGIGVIAFVFGVVGMVLVAVYASDTDRLMPMEHWINRCFFGKQDHREKGNGMALTDFAISVALKEFFFASRGGQITMQSHKERVLFDTLDAGRQYLAVAAKLGSVYLKDSTHSELINAIYLNIQLPGFTVRHSIFEGTVSLSHKYTKCSIELDISADDDGRLMLVNSSGLPIAGRLLNNDFLGQTYNEEFEPVPKPGQKTYYGIDAATDEHYDSLDGALQGMREKQGPGLMQINQKLGEFYSFFQLQCILNYWPEGKIAYDKAGQAEPTERLPILVDYSYEG